MSRPLPARGAIVAALREAERPSHPKELARRCGVDDGSYGRFLELLDQLCFDGTLTRLPGNRFQPQAAELHEDRGGVVGVLSVNPRGFGFVAAVGQDDLFIPAEAIGGALHGDRVRARVVARTARGTEGRIEEIVQRRSPRVAGVLRRKRRSAWLEPDDARVRGPIVIVGGAEHGADGDAAVVTITRFPEFGDEAPEGELVSVLGAPGDPNAEVAKILVREQITEDHPEAALVEAEALAAKLQRIPPGERVDLRSVPLPTIDPEDARDHDDAVWVERSGSGYRAWVAIADVSEFVQPGSALDAEALARGCTIYLPDRAIPMLPSALAADLCSLVPDQQRLCLCVRAELDASGTVTDFDVVEGVMRSAAMLTYGGVARALGFDETAPRSAQAEAMKRDLAVLDELARKRRAARLGRGSLDLDLPEARVLLDDVTGAPVDVVRRASSAGMKRAYQMVEELMLMANELMAQWLSKRRCPAVFRVHDKPDSEKLERLVEAAKSLGIPLAISELERPMGLSSAIQQLRKHPGGKVLEMLLLRSLKQATYDIVNIGHFGLASDAYLHFTSPIRRYPDLVVHRQVKALIRGGRPDTSPEAVESLRAAATQSSVRERAAADVEREVVDVYRTLYMRDRIGDQLVGTVTAVVGSGLFVQLDEPFVDVLVRFESLGPDHYEMADDELGVRGLRSGERIRLGDRLEVVIEDVALLRRTVYARRVVAAVADTDERPSRRRGADGPPSRSRRPFEEAARSGDPPAPAAARLLRGGARLRSDVKDRTARVDESRSERERPSLTGRGGTSKKKARIGTVAARAARTPSSPRKRQADARKKRKR